MSQSDDVIDFNKINQKELLMHVYREVNSIKDQLRERDQKSEGKATDLELRVRTIEERNATEKGIRLGLGLAATVISIAALTVSLINALTV